MIGRFLRRAISTILPTARAIACAALRIVKALSKLQVMTPVGQIDFGKGPFPNVFPMIFAGTQWVNAKPGSKFKLDMVVTDNADDPNVPVGAQLVPHNG